MALYEAEPAPAGADRRAGRRSRRTDPDLAKFLDAGKGGAILPGHPRDGRGLGPVRQGRGRRSSAAPTRPATARRGRARRSPAQIK